MRIITSTMFILTSALMAQNPVETPIGGTVTMTGSGIVQTIGVIGGQLADGVLISAPGWNALTGVPYSAVATTQSTQTLADGTHVVHDSSQALYRDSQGRERREENTAGTGVAQAPQAVFVTDPVAGVRYMLNPSRQTATRMPLAPRPPQGQQRVSGNSNVVSVNGISVSSGMVSSSVGGPTMVHKASDDGSTLPAPENEHLGSRTIEGLVAQGTRSTITIPVGKEGNDRELQIVDERWYSPELKATVLSRHSDPRTGETVYRLTGINRTEPPASMFEVPPDYTVIDPLVAK